MDKYIENKDKFFNMESPTDQLNFSGEEDKRITKVNKLNFIEFCNDFLFSFFF